MSNAIDDLLVPDDLDAPLSYLFYLLQSPSTMGVKALRDAHANALTAVRRATIAQGYCYGEMRTMIFLSEKLPDSSDLLSRMCGLRAVNNHNIVTEQYAALKKAILPLHKHAKPIRPASRPRKDDLDPHYLAVTALVAMSPKAKHREVVRQALDNGTLKDRVKIKDSVRTTTTFEAHMKQIGRELRKLEARSGATNNILPFRPKKPARRKPN